MIDALKFVQGAVARKDFVQALTHFHISGGLIKGYNGSLALCSPIDLDLEATPKAVPFYKAIQACKKTVQLNITPAGKLAIKSGKFRAYIECTTEQFPDVNPSGQRIDLDGSFLKALKVLSPFVAEDDSRRWARGILFRGSSAYATNNVMLIEHWLGYHFPVEVNVPKPAIQELLRIKEEPVAIQLEENAVTFHYADGRWLWSTLYSTQWPDMAKVLDRESNPKPTPKTFFDSVDSLLPFVDELERLFFKKGRITTSPEEGAGASVDLEGLPPEGVYNINQIRLLNGVAEQIDFSLYPKPCLFYGDNVRGAIIGMRG